MTKLSGTTIRCTAGVVSRPCPGVFHTHAVGEIARSQWAGMGWTEVALAGGVGYRCPLHSQFSATSPVYAYRADVDADAQLTMGELGIAADAAAFMHDSETKQR